MTECKGKVGALGIVQLDTPSPALGFYSMEISQLAKSCEQSELRSN